MAKPLKDYLMSLPKGLTNLEKALLLEQKFFMTNHNLVYGDRMSMATGVEMRVPFLDPKIIELASKIPDKFLQKGLTGKWILKKAMEPFLPNKVIYRSKTGFGLPVRDWMHAALEQLEDTHLSSSALQKYDFFNSTKVSELIKRFQKIIQERHIHYWQLHVFRFGVHKLLIRNSLEYKNFYILVYTTLEK